MVSFTLIFFIMIIAVGASAVVGFSLLAKRRNKQLETQKTRQFDEPPVYKSLFEPDDEEIKNLEREERITSATQAAEKRTQDFLSRAAENDLTVLRDCADDKNLYFDVLGKITGGADSGEKIMAAGKFILENKLRSDSGLVGKSGAVWKNSFDKTLTLDYLELAARSENAKIYLDALETVTKARRENFAEDFTNEDYARLAEANFWLLPDSERLSGAGFLAKEKLAELRRQ